MNDRQVRTNNPLNVELTEPPTPWQGWAPERQIDKRFVNFDSMAYGIRAACRTLITYQDKHGLNTVDDIIERWAPPPENDTRSYANFVARRMGVGTGDAIDVQDFATLKALVMAMGKMECGDELSAPVVEEGMKLAGVIPAPGQPSAKKRVENTVSAGAVVVAAGAAITQATEIGRQVTVAAEPLKALNEGLPAILGFLAVLAVVGVILWRRRLAR